MILNDKNKKHTGSIMQHLLALSMILVLSGCVNDYQKFYQPNPNVKNITNIEPLRPNEELKVVNSNGLKSDIRKLLSKNYIVLGASNFNGQLNPKMLKAQANKIDATMVLVSTNYTNTQSQTTNIHIPGTFNWVPITNHQRRYDQSVVYFAKSAIKPKIGVHFGNLTDKQKQEIGMNTGCYIVVVTEDTPAFYANIIPGDIVIKVNDTVVKNIQDMGKQLNKILMLGDKTLSFTIIRNKIKKKITINLNKS